MNNYKMHAASAIEEELTRWSKGNTPKDTEETCSMQTAVASVSPFQSGKFSHASELLVGTEAKSDFIVRWFWRSLLWLSALIPLISVVLSPRVFSTNYVLTLHSTSSNGNLETLLSKATMYFMILICILSAVTGLVRGATVLRAPLLIWLSAMAYAVSLMLSAVLGSSPHLSPRQLFLPAFFTALLFLPRMPLDWFLDEAKRILLSYAYGSAALIGLLPNFALERHYKGMLPWPHFRLHGIAQHANSLAPLLVLYLIIEHYRRSGRRLRWLHLSVVYILLILTQSKTAWVVIGLVYVVRLGYRATRVKGGAALYSWAIMTVLLISAFLLSSTQSALLGDSGGPDSGSASITTFTGRTNVWDYTKVIWRKNIWFGYGPDLWNHTMALNFALRFGWAPGSAHNQWYQSLGQAGLLGAIGLIVYSCALGWAALRNAESTKWMSLEMLVLMVVRSLSETTVPDLPFGLGFLINFVVFGTFLLAITADIKQPNKIPKTGSTEAHFQKVPPRFSPRSTTSQDNRGKMRLYDNRGDLAGSGGIKW